MKTILIILLTIIFSINIYAETNPNDSIINKNTISENNITYKIQIGAFFGKNTDTTFINSLCCNLFVEENKTNKKFLIGNYQSLDQAKYALDVVQKKIVNDAFIVPYINNKRTTFQKLIYSKTQTND